MRPTKLTWLGLALLPFASGAQPGGAEPETAPPQYRVEIIIFAHESFNPSEEAFRREPPPIDTTVTRRVIGPASQLDGGPFPLLPPRATMPPGPGTAPGSAEAGGAERTGVRSGAPDSPAAQAARRLPPVAVQMPPGSEPLPQRDRQTFRFRFLPAGQLELNGAYAAMERLGAYRPLVRGGWIQAALDEQSARPFDLAHLGVSNPSGTIQLHVSRFLHLSLELSYQRAAASTAARSDPGLNEIAVAPRYTLKAERRIRSGELHYFDHPAFGVLIIVRPQPADEDDAAEASPAA